MSEQEIDAIMSAYPSRQLDFPGQEEDGRYTKHYEWTHDTNEYDFFLSVTFDDRHHLVSAYVSEYCK